ncbi:Calcineurin-like phosphoesterase [Rubritalea squalenifaciens DSM 18772]|uniref:Calcineurin-like phosphoesterase n=2 Tax=Rubritalea squalenifaciens TaxID=407226 RepID=A0A1M6JBP3_9BACT|nr:Calcineurin-like phosphoesterase [Rubritalea squalenifaciens DSM 18772]
MIDYAILSCRTLNMLTRRHFTKGIVGSLFASQVEGFAGIKGLKKPSVLDPDRGIEGKGWSMVVLPDTQNYAKFAKNQQHFDLMTEWIRDHIGAWNIKAVLHEGDFVEQNDIKEGGGRGWGEQNSASQWRSAQRSMSTLYGHVPTILTTGNHDYGIRNAETRETQFNNHFGLTDNPLVCDGKGGGIWREGFPNSFGAVTLENALYTFDAPDGRKMLVLSLEWGARDEVVEWAKSVLAKQEYQDHFGILLTHAYLNGDNLRDGTKGHQSGNPHTYPTGKNGQTTNDGTELWEKLVKVSPQLKLVLNGHIMGRHVGYRKDAADGGHKVHQMVFNAQGLGGGSDERGNGGDGWLRILTFEPNGKELSVRTFSPLRQKLGKDMWNTGDDHDFVVSV